MRGNKLCEEMVQKVGLSLSFGLLSDLNRARHWDLASFGRGWIN